VHRSPRTILAVLTVGLLTLTACGSDDDAAGDAPTDGTVTDGELVPVDSAATDDTLATEDPAAAKPTVEVPAELPTELVITDLVVGEGPVAAAGDTVIVDYVGVRTADGTEFDNSYDRGIPFDVKLGDGRVIAGWDEGLLGTQAGGRRQLDIPAELAYGDSPPPGSVIQAGDALTFLIDVRAVVPAPDPADAPIDLELEPSDGATELGVTDVVVGDGAELEAGMTGIVNLLLVRGDNRAVLFDTWAEGDPFQIVIVEGGSLPGLVTGLEGMRVGGQRVLVLPPAEGFGEEGNPQLGLPAGRDLIVVAELVGVY
jgi:peptidylprolyl isomerase